MHVLAMLDHPNIISYYDSFEEDGVVMIEMEYADGGYVTSVLLHFNCYSKNVAQYSFAKDDNNITNMHMWNHIW